MFSLILLLGLATVSKQENDVPEDEKLSSGYSVIWGNMVKIDNYANVQNYEYKVQKKNRGNAREYTLQEKDYYFLDKINVYETTGNVDEEYPQGLCITDQFILISSYSGVRGNLGKIKVFDKESGEYLISLGMDATSHMGGLTYDGKYIWVCNSSRMSLERIPYTFIQQMVYENKGSTIDARNLLDRYRLKNIPSCVSFYDGQLWVATHSIWTNATMVGYHYNEDLNQLNPIGSFWVPPKVQGVAFSEEGEVFLSTSYGRKNSSYIKKYESIYTMTNDVDEYAEQIELPPCSEGIVYENKNIYVLFESAGKKYREGIDGKGMALAPLNRILVIQDEARLLHE